MINLKNRKHLKIIAGISLLLIILGAIFNVNRFLMSATIGVFVGSLVQMFIHKKRIS
ncbi:hypothetical protein SAMN05421857_2779 [Chryseobacterium formosense]|uniref:hypothetical protein n=1 Tax=Chryseobacterium TaxID=59732 RepID=UPI0008F34915|nr:MULTISPECIES: hypothetical protein [Chryseobacterium]SFT72742.1 hypothetical protein SAMN05421857_2779 [Chryseobacterium formosense]